MLRPIRKALLLPGAIPRTDRGINSTFDAFIRTQNSQDIVAVVKCGISDEEIIIELLASKLLEEVDILTPEAFLVYVDNTKFRGWALATEKIDKPSLRIYGQNNKSLIASYLNILISNNKIVLAQTVSYDEFILNIDRNLGNVLWDGRDNLWLIDHGFSMLKASQCAKSLQYNKLLRMICELGFLQSRKKINTFFGYCDTFISSLRE